jgi:hypothetical protein
MIEHGMERGLETTTAMLSLRVAKKGAQELGKTAMEMLLEVLLNFDTF